MLAFLSFGLSLPIAKAIGPLFGNGDLAGEIAKFDQEFKDVPEINAKTWRNFDKKTREKFVLVDVRDAKERQVSVIPGAISLAEFQATCKKQVDKPVVAYCTIGYRSAKAARQLRRQGIAAFNFRGGVVGWTQVGGSLEDENGKATKRVHTYGRAWNFVPRNYTAVW